MRAIPASGNYFTKSITAECLDPNTDGLVSGDLAARAPCFTLLLRIVCSVCSGRGVCMLCVVYDLFGPWKQYLTYTAS